MKKTSKILVAVCIILMIITMSVVSYGTDSASDVLSRLDGKTEVSTTGITNLGNSIISVIQVVGIIIAVVILLVLGIKYMMGSAEEKADYKKSMIPYIVGAVLIFAATSIVKVVYDISTSITSSGAASEH